MGVAQHHARRRLDRSPDRVTIRDRTRSTLVDDTTGEPTWTIGPTRTRIPAIIFDTTASAGRDVDPQRDINVKQLEVKVGPTVAVELGQQVEVTAAADPQLVDVTGTITSIDRSGTWFRTVTVTTTGTP